jgi:membrane protein DedA with SNARE-associated domain
MELDGIFFLMVLESALIPIPSEVIMPFSGFLASVGKLGMLGAILAGSFRNLVGSIATYYLGLRLGRTAIIRYGKYVFKKKHLEYTERLFEKYGDKVTFVGRLLPAVRTYIPLPAGIGLTNFIEFTVYTFVGSLIWNTLHLTYSGIELGINWRHIGKYSGYLYTIAIISTNTIIYFCDC